MGSIFLERGLPVHAHTNGDLSAAALIDMVRTMQEVHPRPDHRTALEHFAYSTDDQSRQMAALGMVVSANPYYQYLLADIYADEWLGPDRGRHMVRLGSLQRHGVPFGLHSALRAITIDAAWIMGAEDDIGSIRAGKRADFTVLESDPYRVKAERLKDIDIWGVVFEGELHPVE